MDNLSNLETLSLNNNQLTGCFPEEWQNRIMPGNEGNQLGLPVCPPTAGTDKHALVALYNATDGPKWLNNDNWLSGEPLGNWYGVTTHYGGPVTKLILEANDLSGELPPELGNLANLETLNLSYNDLSGAIPPELGSLPNLTRLYLVNNQLSGEIPSELGNLASLTALLLNENQLAGEIPAELGNLSNLTRLYLADNQLTGCIPVGLPSLNADGVSRLRLPVCRTPASLDKAALVALYNATDGPNWGNNANWLSNIHIGHWYGVTTDDEGRVIELDLSSRLSKSERRRSLPFRGEWPGNKLSGEIPPELGNLSNMKSLDLRGNQLDGAIPPELGNLPNLKGLGLSQNQLDGAIPPELGNLSNLEWIPPGTRPEPVDRADTPGVWQLAQPGTAVPRPEPVDRGDTPGVGQPAQPGTAVPLREPVGRGDTPGVGQPAQPGTAVPRR